MITNPLCARCIHKHADLTCAAFPARIPDDITFGRSDHTEPYPGDNGIQFEPVEEAPQDDDDAQ